MKPQVGLVTVLFNSQDVLPGFFKSLAAQTYTDYWLYIIDNSLDDLSFEKAQEQLRTNAFTNFTLIKNQQNIGVAAGNNQGIKLSLDAGCEYVLLLNNDIEFDDSSLVKEMVREAAESGEKILVPKIYFYDTGRIWYAGGYVNKFKATTTHVGEGEKDSPRRSVSGYVGYAPTCFMLIHRSVFQMVGIMDEIYFVYYDDTDFVYRAQKAHVKIKYFPSRVVLHKVSSSTGGSLSEFSVFYGERNRIYFIRKNLPVFFLIVSAAYFIVTRLIKSVVYEPKLKAAMFSGIAAGLRLKSK